MDRDERTAVAEAAARDGAALAFESFRTDLAVETKDGKTDEVTQADRDAQAEVLATIRETYPDDVVVGEEDDARKDVPDDGASWVIDPIDGTSNVVRGVHVWATAVAAVRDGEAVAGVVDMPAVGDVFVADADAAVRNGDAIRVSDETDPEAATVAPALWWDRDRRDEFAVAAREIGDRFGDMRRYGCAQATLAYVACGALDGAFSNVRPNPWDTVAGVHLVRRAGGTVTDLNGDPWRHDSVGIVASNGELHDEVLAAARATEAVADG